MPPHPSPPCDAAKPDCTEDKVGKEVDHTEKKDKADDNVKNGTAENQDRIDNCKYSGKRARAKK